MARASLICCDGAYANPNTARDQGGACVVGGKRYDKGQSYAWHLDAVDRVGIVIDRLAPITAEDSPENFMRISLF